jgi:hypothetical protein
VESFGCCAIASVVAIGLLVSACGSSSPAPPPTGTIQGRLLTYGGLSLSPQGRPFEGHVRATAAKGKAVVVAVPSDGNFALQLPAGTYSLTGASPEYGDGLYLCLAPDKVTVAPGRTAKQDVICSEK